MTYYIYILELVDNKYYIGKSKIPDIRLNKHFKNAGSCWTRKHPPISVLEVFEETDSLDEDFCTIRYMKKYGIDNVRGGSFCRLILAEEEKTVLLRLFRSAKDVCFLCGSDKHFVRHCKLNKKYKKDNVNNINITFNILSFFKCFVCK